MLKLYTTLSLGVLMMLTRAHATLDERRRAERGSVTMEQVLWAVAVIAIVGIVVAAIKAFVTSKSGEIR